jgi:DTW domain-containing protein
MRDPAHEPCERCLLQRRVCLCAEIPVLASRTRIVIVRHHLERHRSSNTGRLAHMSLTNSELIEHGGTNGPAILPPLDGAMLLYPLGEVTTICPEPPPRLLVVLDATWSQARRMYRKLAPVRGLPILHIPDDDRVAERLRASPGGGRVSTIEAIAGALRLLEGDVVATALERLFDIAVARTRATGRLVR